MPLPLSFDEIIFNFVRIQGIRSPDCVEGGIPETGLLLAKDGNFYGSTTAGGITGYGTLFKITPQGHLTVLHNLCALANCGDGSRVITPLIQGRDGTLYGTSITGGLGSYLCFSDCGLVFKMSLKGVFNVLYSFCSQPNCVDGAMPNGLIQGTDSNFYGTTQSSPNLYGQGGTVFQLTTTGIITTLYTFCAQLNCADGGSPMAGVFQGSDGNLYGTTRSGGVNDVGAGTVFKITPRGAITTIYGFCALPDCADGAGPQGVLAQGTDGNFYGTTTYRGAYNGGTLFKLSSNGTLAVLHNFPGWRHDYPGVIQATDGNLYGDHPG
jgi:uncharacterized repeat protein (TIGR03803 family)